MLSPWATAKRILCVRLDSIGDVMMTTPAIHAIKGAIPDRHVTLLTSPEGGKAVPLLPEVDDCIVYRPPWMKATPRRADSDGDLAMIARLREGNFDAAVIFTVYSQSPLPAALLCYLAGIPLRVAHCRENPYQLLSDWIPEEEPEKRIRHEVRRQLDLAAFIGCEAKNDRMQLDVPPRAKLTIRNLLERSGLDWERPWIVIHAGASAPSRRYPPEMFARAATALSEKHGLQLIFTGIQEERKLVEEIRMRLRAKTISLVGCLKVPELAALLEIAPLLLSNNTGPVHIAAALRTPVVVLYALTNPQHEPWKTPSRVLFHEVPCKNCLKSMCPLGHQLCLRGVTPERVVAAVLEMLTETKESENSQDISRTNERDNVPAYI